MSGFVDALLYWPELVYTYCTKTDSHETNPTGATYPLTPEGGEGWERNRTLFLYYSYCTKYILYTNIKVSSILIKSKQNEWICQNEKVGI